MFQAFTVVFVIPFASLKDFLTGHGGVEDLWEKVLPAASESRLADSSDGGGSEALGCMFGVGC